VSRRVASTVRSHARRTNAQTVALRRLAGAPSVPVRPRCFGRTIRLVFVPDDEAATDAGAGHPTVANRPKLAFDFNTAN
jgi:hypothetical protein